MYNFFVSNYRKDSKEYDNGSFILSTDNWDDFGYETKFHMYYMNEDEKILIGEIKIGFLGQEKTSSNNVQYNKATRDELPVEFHQLDKKFFSLGQSARFYERLYKLFDNECKVILGCLNDLSVDYTRISALEDENVYKTSLLRSISEWEIKNHFYRLAEGQPLLDDYNFVFKFKEQKLHFQINALSHPPTNIHALIGKNGVGKTTILTEMFDSLAHGSEDNFFVKKHPDFPDFEYMDSALDNDYFSKVIFISYSIFGKSIKSSNLKRFSYIGLKEERNEELIIKNVNNLYQEFNDSLGIINSSNSLDNLFSKVIDYFSNSYDRELIENLKKKEFRNMKQNEFISLSSGHSIVLLIIVNLIVNVTEKTLVLFDEPETHLHPPLLSALIRAINEIVVHKNGVCIFATHSPVVIQEIPRSCVHVIRRVGSSIETNRPTIESFGENVSNLTHEVFSLEVSMTGFYNLVKEAFEREQDIDKVSKLFNAQLGSEAMSLLYLLKYNDDDRNLSDEP